MRFHALNLAAILPEGEKKSFEKLQFQTNCITP